MMIDSLIAGLTCGIATFYGMGDGFHGLLLILTCLWEVKLGLQTKIMENK
jgi:uncharacterized membrane protein